MIPSRLKTLAVMAAVTASLGCAVAMAEPKVRMEPEKIEARLGDFFEVRVICSWRPSRDGNLELTDLAPPQTDLAERVGRSERVSSDSEEGLLKIERAFVYRFKALKAGEAVLHPARAEFKLAGDKPLSFARESGEAILAVRHGWRERSPWVIGAVLLIAAAVAFAAAHRPGSGPRKKGAAGTFGESLSWRAEILAKIDDAKRFRFEGDARRAMSLLEEAARLYALRRFGSEDAAAAADPSFARWRGEIIDAASQIRFAGRKAPVEEQDSLIRGFEAFVRTHKPEAL